MTTIRLTMAQALVRFLVAQNSEIDGQEVPLFAGVFAIFGHGNVAGLGEALYEARDRLPTLRAHNEQAMALAAIAFAKASRRRRMMACTTSIGPGATNMVTAAAVAHANRLPVLLLPGDVFAGRRPDPVLQQIEPFRSDRLPTLRAHNEQAMGLAAIAFAKASRRRRIMACTTSIGPGATNMVTAAAVAHANRLPVLLLPGDVFAGRRPDPVLQQIEAFGDPTISVNDCFRPVSRWWDRITRPEQILQSLPQAMRVLTDPAECGPVTLALPQDVQTEADDYPEEFFRPRLWRFRRAPPDEVQLAQAAAALTHAKAPLLIAGGGVHYSLATDALAKFAERHAIPVAETQAGKGALPWDHPAAVGAIGVTGASAANQLAAEADLVLAVGTRLGDFATGSRALFQGERVALVALNVQAFDGGKHGALPVV